MKVNTDDEKIKVLIVDDHPIVVQGIVSLLVGESQIKIVGTAANGAECLSFIHKICPDVILLDVNLPDGCGIDLSDKIKAINPQVKIIILTAFHPKTYAKKMQDKKVDCFLAKDCRSHEIVKAVFTVSDRKQPFSPEFRNLKNELTSREREILDMIIKGMQNKEIAFDLKITIRTVDYHVSNILKKLGVNSRLEAAIKWMKMISV